MFAVIRTGGKQYRVEPGQVIQVERLKTDGSTYSFEDVLLIHQDDGSTIIGSPKINQATVTAEVLGDGQAKKVVIQKFKSKIRYRRKRGHRQQFTKVKIKAVNLPE